MKLALIDAGGANLGSVRYALERLGVTPTLVRTAEELQGAERVILPGVGAAEEGMRRLHAQGLVEALRGLQVPLLGICLGMQLLFESSEEGGVACLGLLSGCVRKLQGSAELRVPHMGWNGLDLLQPSPLLEGINAEAQAYFVHSYAAPVTEECIAACTHGERFAAMVQCGRVAGAQFHPERSAAVGARVLENFLAWNPA
ncbi:MAG: imidazole glycerol phosphate synthase subunit HisH [Thermomonas sp.]|uniref:imidazole glycerol phosphate synthase subunit HisH n=1 Tax=Thermomonas sp. TaxID=1971895 RepID=UPI001EBD412D|nr:imidazole glycerol phosphate synthase subunit HisH [Thermomonas sp.]MBV2207967.1 imidazole glycerol phosphate synthase subunit HisH [Thermomonas sp.]